MGEIKFDKRNYRKHNTKNKELIRKSLEDCGAGRSIVIDNDDEIIAGNGIYEQAQKLGIKTKVVETDGSELVVVKRTDLSRGDERRSQLAIMDNSTSDSSGFDFDLLEEDFDLDVLEDWGIDGILEDKKFEDVLMEQGEGRDFDDLTAEEKGNLENAYKEYAKEVKDIQDLLRTKGYYSENITKSRAELNFLKALYLNKKYVINNNNAFHCDIMDTKTASGRCKNDYWEVGNVKKFDYVSPNTYVFDYYQMSLRILGCKEPTDFPVKLARNIYNVYGGENGKVLDMCHGWGGRLVGFLLSECAEYVGYDTNTVCSNEVQEIGDRFNKYVNKKFTLKNHKFEDADEKDEYFDVAFTSPPYYDTEKYDGEESSWKMYPTYEDWEQGFLKTMIEKCKKYVKTGGYIILNVGNTRYKIGDSVKNISKELGLKFIEEKSLGMTRVGKSIMDENEQQTGEMFYIFKKDDELEEYGDMEDEVLIVMQKE